MDLTKLVTTIVSGIVTNKDDIKIEEFTSEDEITIEVLVKEEDMGRLIGKNGKTINAIRTLLQATSYQNGNKRVKINVDKF
jgi:hypothetical protein